jgi:hypothetical protein
VILVGAVNRFYAGADLSMVKGITDLANRQRLIAQTRIHWEWLKGR